jgi:hypothetical protein
MPDLLLVELAESEFAEGLLVDLAVTEFEFAEGLFVLGGKEPVISTISVTVGLVVVVIVVVLVKETAGLVKLVSSSTSA